MSWQEALKAVMKRYRDKDEVWGLNDCCQFAREYVLELTGIDHELPFYDSEAEAMRVLETNGGLKQMVIDRLGIPHETPKPGDVVMWERDESRGLGVFNGEYIIGGLPKGLARFKLPIVAAW